ncbi:transposase IS200 like family protein, partial [Lyngbya aestuarii BL J]
MFIFFSNTIGDIALSNLVNNLKSVTSRKLRQEFSDHLNSF